MDVKKLVSQMTLEEKASLCSGADFWHTKAVERLGIPSMMVSDGPHGLRKQDLEADNLGVNNSIKAVCFPAACALACSFDRNLIYKMGQAIGNECQSEDVGVILGPGANIKRSPICGRNFEYFSEDPYLASQMAANHIKGVQSQGVGTSLKHFLANNQETRRFTVSAEIDERTLNEIYLSAFETAVKEGQPWTVMCSYNRVNGVFSSENSQSLTEILRNKWGFNGFTVSDWGAVNDRVKGIEAGLDLEMPSSGGKNDLKIVQAVKNGMLSEDVVDQASERILNIVYKYLENRKQNAVWDKDADHMLAAQIESECMVLLKNDDNILPLDKNKKIAFIGKFASEPRYQGGGSSHINSFKVTSTLEAAAKYAEISYAQGYRTDVDMDDEILLNEAVKLASESEVAVVFAGLTDLFESEGFDRTHMQMPKCQNELIRRVAEANLNTVVVLHNGSPVEMPWLNSVKGLVEAYLGGQGVGTAISDVLFGKTNPSGKLAETFPVRIEDNPSYLNFPGEEDTVQYREGLFVGYRYYDYKKMNVLFPFGYGLSYTTFEYSNIKLSSTKISDEDTVKVSVDVKNTGDCKGKEIVQLYVRDCESSVIRPIKELKGFEKIELNPNETKTVSFTLDKRSFAYYNTEIHDWYVESGEFEIMIGKSSQDIAVSEKIYVESTVKLPFTCNMNTTFSKLFEMDFTKPYTDKYCASFFGDVFNSVESNSLGESTRLMMEKQMEDNPLRAMVSFSDGRISYEELEEFIDFVNENY